MLAKYMNELNMLNSVIFKLFDSYGIELGKNNFINFIA